MAERITNAKLSWVMTYLDSMLDHKVDLRSSGGRYYLSDPKTGNDVGFHLTKSGIYDAIFTAAKVLELQKRTGNFDTKDLPTNEEDSS